MTGTRPDLHYGHLFSEPPSLPHLHGTSRSGLSPRFIPTAAPSPADSSSAPPLPNPHHYEAERQYQRTKLGGYTSTTLHALGALASGSYSSPFSFPSSSSQNSNDTATATATATTTPTPSLTNPLHPLFSPDMWATSITSDAQLWDALLPSLQLASRVLSNAHCWPWWDALVYGERRWIASPPATRAGVMRTFHARSRREGGFVAHDAAFVERFRRRIRYMAAEGNSGVTMRGEGGEVLVHCNSAGYTEYLPDFGMARVTFAWQMIRPLLRDDLWDSERLLSQFQIAKTILHEFVHAIGMLLDTDLGRNLRYGEPFFEDQIISELGESMENDHFGGRIWSWPSSLSAEAERPILAISVQEWPNYSLVAEKVAQGLTHQIHPNCGNSFHPGSTNENMAIPISWVESLFQEDFWAIYVRCFGADAIKPYPRLIINGSVITSIHPATHEAQVRPYTVFGPDWDAYQRMKIDGSDSDMEGNTLSSFAHRMDAERVEAAYRQCAILERAMSKYWARTGDYVPET